MSHPNDLRPLSRSPLFRDPTNTRMFKVKTHSSVNNGDQGLLLYFRYLLRFLLLLLIIYTQICLAWKQSAASLENIYIYILFHIYIYMRSLCKLSKQVVWGLPTLCFFLKIYFYFMCMGVLPAWMSVNYIWVCCSHSSRGECLRPWNWSFRQLWIIDRTDHNQCC